MDTQEIQQKYDTELQKIVKQFTEIINERNTTIETLSTGLDELSSNLTNSIQEKEKLVNYVNKCLSVIDPKFKKPIKKQKKIENFDQISFEEIETIRKERNQLLGHLKDLQLKYDTVFNEHEKTTKHHTNIKELYQKQTKDITSFNETNTSLREEIESLTKKTNSLIVSKATYEQKKELESQIQQLNEERYLMQGTRKEELEQLTTHHQQLLVQKDQLEQEKQELIEQLKKNKYSVRKNIHNPSISTTNQMKTDQFPRAGNSPDPLLNQNSPKTEIQEQPQETLSQSPPVNKTADLEKFSSFKYKSSKFSKPKTEAQVEKPNETVVQQQNETLSQSPPVNKTADLEKYSSFKYKSSKFSSQQANIINELKNKPLNPKSRPLPNPKPNPYKNLQPNPQETPLAIQTKETSLSPSQEKKLSSSPIPIQPKSLSPKISVTTQKPKSPDPIVAKPQKSISPPRKTGAPLVRTSIKLKENLQKGEQPQLSKKNNWISLNLAIWKGIASFANPKTGVPELEVMLTDDEKVMRVNKSITKKNNCLELRTKKGIFYLNFENEKEEDNVFRILRKARI
ncbi:myosin heavy chain non-muscle [Anaeramoeba ignava]|uniref:Myosin heavy chain non-muscle n=1 Tax=Anaeramoeba ignava TaxID=1746090 RepID=A0A9Q0LEI4_ANAIG|nr:myosin heavy chain non-muscle [Anaeramoeba ignava]